MPRHENVDPIIKDHEPECWKGCCNWDTINAFCKITCEYTESCIPWYQNRIEELEKTRAETVTIPKSEYEALKKDSEWLSCLEAAGVDNWAGYDCAREMLDEQT